LTGDVLHPQQQPRQTEYVIAVQMGDAYPRNVLQLVPALDELELSLHALAGVEQEVPARQT
jgi:hypothetical protein